MEEILEVIWDRANPSAQQIAGAVMHRLSLGRVGISCITFYVKRPEAPTCTVLRLTVLHALHFSGKTPDICSIQGEGTFDDDWGTPHHVGIVYNFATKRGTCRYA